MRLRRRRQIISVIVASTDTGLVVTCTPDFPIPPFDESRGGVHSINHLMAHLPGARLVAFTDMARHDDDGYHALWETYVIEYLGRPKR